MITFKQFILEKFLLTIKYHDKLNPKLWTNSKINDGIVPYLIKNARKFAAFSDVPRVAVDDIVMTGGNCNYNYTKFSDIDVHIMCNEIDLDDTKYFKKKYEWTQGHPELKVHGYPVEFYIQNEIEHFPNGQGVYSILHDKWVVIPNHLDSIDILKDPKTIDQIQYYIQTSKYLLQCGTKQDILDFKTKLWQMRSAGLEKGGEFSIENIIYKELRNRQLVDKLNQKLDELT